MTEMVEPMARSPHHDGSEPSKSYWSDYIPRYIEDCHDINKIHDMTPLEREEALAPIHSEADAQRGVNDWDSEDVGSQLSMIGLKEGEMVEVATFGDLVLLLDGGVRVLVNSQVLTANSKLFALMLRSTMREGRLVPNHQNPPVIELPENNTDTMLRLCRILHGTYDVMKDKVLEKPAAWKLQSTRSAARVEARARKALLDLAQLIHKWDCYSPFSLISPELQDWTASPTDGWNLSAASTCSFFFEDRQSFASDTAQLVIGWDSNIGRKMPGPLGRAGVVSELAWPDLFDGDDFYYLVKNAADAATARFLENLQMIVDYFISNRGAWHISHGGYMWDDPHDERWHGMGPPDDLSKQIQDWNSDRMLDSVHLPAASTNPPDHGRTSERDDGVYIGAPSLLRVIDHFIGFNEKTVRDPDKQRRLTHTWLCPRQCQPTSENGLYMQRCFKNRAWLPHGMYLRSDDGSRHLMYLYDCIRDAIDDVATLVDNGICLHYARSGRAHDNGKCFAYPCWTNNVLDFEFRWTPWPTSEDDRQFAEW